ncbi:uncharacterized protein LOC128736205 [Sabethes cyaneus]|uniref:uncharacterized protein LOC128736205 n=1 Tax=Sabethes cyaneus TaxID=53552 RepID=UPI00237D8817|nr:uncharacterized protein LOC128736205 [Sabethes cyaneus]
MDTATTENLASKRKVIYAKVKWELSVAENIRCRKPSAAEVLERRSKLTELANHFDVIQTAIEEETAHLEDVASVFNHRLLFDEVYFQVKDIYTQYLEEKQENSSVRSSNSEGTSDLRDAIKALLETQQAVLARQPALEIQSVKHEPHINVKLPQLNIPVFNGERKNWRSFKDLFEGMIHNRTDLKESVKMQYLFSYIDGEAKRMVNSFPISDANYHEAWETLIAHYDKNKYTVFALIREFLEQPSASNTNGLKKLVNVSDDVIRQLKALGNEYETRDPWLIHLLLDKVDKDTRSLWAQKIIDIDNPSFMDFFDFLQKRCDALETCSAFVKKTSFDIVKKENPRASGNERKLQAFHTAAAAATPISCAKCSNDHPVYQCESFKAMDVPARRQLALSSRLCYNCLRPSHTAKHCTSKSVCHIAQCKQRHHTLLCRRDVKRPEQQNDAVIEPEEQNTEESSISANAAQAVISSSEPSTFSLLPTVVANIKGVDGKSNEVRILIDSGSQASLITEACVKRLGLQRINAKVEVTGVNGEVVGTTACKVSLIVSSRFDDSDTITTQAYVLGKLTASLPCQQFSASDMPYLKGLQLADPRFNKSSTVDVILGADVFLSILRSGQVKNLNGIPEFDIDRTLRMFWEDQELRNSQPLTEEEKRVINHFESTFTRTEEGRFIVKLPLDDSKQKLGESLTAAVKRLRAMERRFQNDENFMVRYTTFMQEYIRLGHMQLIPDSEIAVDQSRSCYLPHHGVIKEDSLTTKLRVVFDGSCVTSSGVSLNDLLLSAPNINADLFDALLRFRSYPIVFTADVEKMYRQVLVHPDDTDYQRIVWRDSPDMPIQHFRLLTVTYGLKNSGFLAMAALKKAAEVHEKQYPEAVERIKKHTYVDDLTSGADSAQEAMVLIKQINEILHNAGFILRKWSSNSATVLDSLCDVNVNAKPINLPDEQNSVKALGIHWLPEEDVFTLKVNFRVDGPNTKHQLLSDTARLFDPFGWFAPVIIRAKILYQHCWLYDLNWHDPLPPCIEDAWVEMKQNLWQLEQVKIPRWMANFHGRIELHGFSDASEEAYAAVVYMRSIDEDGRIHVSLIAAKTKVAPVKQVTIPRLELNAAELLAKLMKQVAEPLERFQVQQYAWTDSTIVLQWLSNHPRKWNTYVGNRASTILDILPRRHWGHVSTHENPADCASRGINPSELIDHPLWWSGPHWLAADSSSWKRNVPPEDFDDGTLEVRKRFQTLNTMIKLPGTSFEIERQILERKSTLHAACRQLAYVNRFITNMKAQRSKQSKLSGTITLTELHEARLQYARLAQHDVYAREMDSLKGGSEVFCKSKISDMYPFLDSDGTMRVGGRLQHSARPFRIMHPVILPKEHRVTRLLIEELHVQNCHAGPSLLTATINQYYYVKGCQDVVKQVIRNCVKCCRLKAKTAQQLMGSLPAARVTAYRPFAHVGVDYAGPILIRCSNTRGERSMKGYIVVFVCLSTKAVHLEAAGDLTTATFLGALKRMIARRGYCNEIWSDNGTNLVGADRQLRETYTALMSHGKDAERFLSSLGIQWRFISPSSPHQGGIWEAAVKSAKGLLRPIVGNEKLTFEELTTVLCQIEACLNSRPLCPMSSSPDNCEALTPGHFLVGQPLNLLPEPDVSRVQMNRLDHWEKVQRYTIEFWNRWRNEYLATLQSRGKWRTRQENIKPGQLVLVKSDNVPPSAWELARVSAVHPDQQGLVRIVTLRRGKTEYQRPVQKLCPLPD